MKVTNSAKRDREVSKILREKNKKMPCLNCIVQPTCRIDAIYVNGERCKEFKSWLKEKNSWAEKSNFGLNYLHKLDILTLTKMYEKKESKK